MPPAEIAQQQSGAKIFVVVAAYNEAQMIQQVIQRLAGVYSNIVVVDDGSTDATWERLQRLNVFALRHFLNRGQGAALQTGIRFALLHGADIIVTFDADGQHREDDIEALIGPILRQECDVTLGSRFLGHAHDMPRSRWVLLKLGVVFTWLVSRLGISDAHNGLRAFSRNAASGLQISMDRMAHASEILDQIKSMGWRYKEVPVSVHYSAYSRKKGQSSLNAIIIGWQVLLKKISH